MPSDRGRSMANDSVHILIEQDVVETGKDLFKPINSNPTSSRVVNPFEEARKVYIRQIREKEKLAQSQR